MIEIKGIHSGDLVCSENTRLLGSVTGAVTIEPNVNFILNGTVSGNVDFLAGASGEVNGTVFGTLTNFGSELYIRGVVKSLVDRDKANLSKIDKDAVVELYQGP